jgi:Mce-associated membrane protein
MADDAAAPDGEVSDSAATEEASSATEPESGARETTEAADTDKVTDADTADYDEEALDEEALDEEALDEEALDEEALDEEASEEEAAPAKPRMSHLRLAAIAGLALVVALAGLTGWLGFRAYQSHQADVQRKLFLQVGRQGALNLTTIDWQQADKDVQRILDSATGTFYDDFQKRSQPFVDVVKQAQSKSVGSIAEAGLESESADGAQVLVAVTVKTSNAGAPEQAPRAWRMRIGVQKVGDEAKVSNVEFVP